jgi:ribosome biogenesis protein BMS1
MEKEQNKLDNDKEEENKEEIKMKKDNKIKYYTEVDEPPLIIMIQGGHSSGKTTLIKSLVKYYTNQNITSFKGSITVRNSKNQRLTFIECPNDISSLDDCSKIVDVAILLIDARVGFEMETFEFISLLKNHGFTQIVGVITHMDDFRQNKSLSKYKKQIKKRFIKDATDKSKLFYLFGIKNNLYIKLQLHTMARYLKVIKPNQPGFRINHPYIFCDRYDINFSKIQKKEEEKNEDVIVSLFGYVRGNHLNKNSLIYINGLGEFNIDFAEKIEDPCPIEMVSKNGKVKRTLKKKDKNLYAPYSNINMLEYDRKSGYINIPEKLITFTKGLKETDNLANDEGVQMVRKLQDMYGNIEQNDEDEKNQIELIEGINMDSKNQNKKKNDSENKNLNKEKEVIEENMNDNNQTLDDNNEKKEKKEEEYNIGIDKMLLEENEDTNIMKEIYGNIEDEKGLNGNELFDSYKTDDNSEDFDLDYLIKNCKQKFITGGYFDMENENDDDINENEDNEKETDVKNVSSELTPEQKKEEQEKKLKFFLDDSSSYGIFKLGTYIRIDLKKVKRKYANHFDPNHPIILSTLSHQESEKQMSFIKIRFNKHLWFPKILKTNDPIILSIGWRKFQTTMAYCVEDKNHRLRLIKYTPKFTNCIAICYGPQVPINVAVVAMQNDLGDTTDDNFRISGTGDVIEVNQSFDIVKKLKLIGDPEEIYKKTANIKNMFNSNLEVARYIGAKIQTVSGIRGIIKKQLNTKPEGRFRATFEDKILKSDVVFLKTWAPVELNKFYNPIIEYGDKKQRMLRTMSQLRKDYGIKLEQKPDSEYKDIEREERVFPNLVISKNLEKNLPFKKKNKNINDNKEENYHLKKLGLPYKKQIKSYMTTNEKNIYSLMQRLQTLQNIKEKKLKKATENYKLKEKKEEEKKEILQKKRRREKMSKSFKKKKE